MQLEWLVAGSGTEAAVTSYDLERRVVLVLQSSGVVDSLRRCFGNFIP